MNRDEPMVGDEDEGGVSFEDGRYFDWSDSREGGGRSFEVGDERSMEAAAVDLTWSELERVQRALTRLLLTREGE